MSKQAKEGGRNRKLGRHARNPSSQQQAARSATNKIMQRGRGGGFNEGLKKGHIPLEVIYIGAGMSPESRLFLAREWHAHRKWAKVMDAKAALQKHCRAVKSASAATAANAFRFDLSKIDVKALRGFRDWKMAMRWQQEHHAKRASKLR